MQEGHAAAPSVCTHLGPSGREDPNFEHAARHRCSRGCGAECRVSGAAPISEANAPVCELPAPVLDACRNCGEMLCTGRCLARGWCARCVADPEWSPVARVHSQGLEPETGKRTSKDEIRECVSAPESEDDIALCLMCRCEIPTDEVFWCLNRGCKYACYGVCFECLSGNVCRVAPVEITPLATG